MRITVRRIVLAAVIAFALGSASGGPAVAHEGHRSCAPGASPLAVSLPPGTFGAGVASLAKAGAADAFVRTFHATECA